MRHLIYLMFRCDVDVMESLELGGEFFWELNTARGDEGVKTVLTIDCPSLGPWGCTFSAMQRRNGQCAPAGDLSIFMKGKRGLPFPSAVAGRLQGHSRVNVAECDGTTRSTPIRSERG